MELYLRDPQNLLTVVLCDPVVLSAFLFNYSGQPSPESPLEVVALRHVQNAELDQLLVLLWEVVLLQKGDESPSAERTHGDVVILGESNPGHYVQSVHREGL